MIYAYITANTIQCIQNLLAKCLRLLGMFLRTLLLLPAYSPKKMQTQYWKPCHIKDIHEAIVDRSCVFLTIFKKSCTTNEAEALDKDADQII